MSIARNDRILKIIFPIIVVAVISACNWNGRDGRPDIGSNTILSLPKELCAVLYPETSSFASSRKSVVSAVIINNGTSEIMVNFWTLGQSMLALDVHDTQGKRMLTIGPSTPLPQKEMAKYIRQMKPGERVDIEYNLNIFSPELPPGKYSVSMREIPSNRVHIRIRGGIIPF